MIFRTEVSHTPRPSVLRRVLYVCFQHLKRIMFSELFLKLICITIMIYIPFALCDPVDQSPFWPPFVPSLDFCSDLPISFRFDWYLEPENWKKKQFLWIKYIFSMEMYMWYIYECSEWIYRSPFLNFRTLIISIGYLLWNFPVCFLWPSKEVVCRIKIYKKIGKV